MKKNWYKNIGLVFLAFAIAFSPRFSAGVIPGVRIIEIRVEDILIVALGIACIVQLLLSHTKKIRKPPLFLPIIAWLSFGLISTLINLLLGNIQILRAFFFFLKEIEFFVFYFYAFYHINDLDSAKFILSLWITLGLINVGWIIIELLTGIRYSYYYGPTLFTEPQNPFGSGVFFLINFTFLFNIFLYYLTKLNSSFFKKGILMIATVLISVGIFASGSQTALIGFIVALSLTFLLYLIKSKLQNPSLIGIAFLVVCGVVLILSLSNGNTIRRQTSIEKIVFELNTSEHLSRVSIWKYYIAKPFEYPLGPLIGVGKSFVGEAHNLFVRIFVETGLIGVSLFSLLIFSILTTSFQEFLKEKDPFIVGVSSALVVTTFTALVISMGGESFIYGVKISEIYWFFVGIAMAALTIAKQKKDAYRIDIK